MVRLQGDCREYERICRYVDGTLLGGPWDYKPTYNWGSPYRPV